MMKNMKLLGLGIGLAVAFTISNNAMAEDAGIGVGVHIGGHDHGHYEDRTESVMVAPAVTERRLVPATYENVVQLDGTVVQRKVTDEHYEEFVVAPARYETRTTRVWVEERKPGLKLGIGLGL